MKYLHYETVELYKDTLDKYNIVKDRELLSLPYPLLHAIAATEFNHDCEDVHHSLDWNQWYENFLYNIYKEK